MKLWLLSPTEAGDRDLGYDCFDGHVVRAATEDEARKMVRHGDEGANFWKDPKRSKCEWLMVEGDAGVILSSFNAG